MKDIAIYGAGGFGKEVACLIHRINSASPQWNLIGFFDDGKAVGTEISHFGMVLGSIEDLNSFDKELSVVIAIGDSKIVKSITDSITNSLITYPNLIDPSTFFADKLTFKIGEGNIIQRNSSFSCDVTVGNFNIMNGSVSLGHDVCLGNYNSLMPGTRISGEVKIGDLNFFGVGSIVLQQIKIGNSVKIGAGAVMMTKPKDESLYIGNPARKF